MTATNRPLARLGVADLEEIFLKQGTDLTVLARLKHELSYRQVPRALALQEKIRKAELDQMDGDPYVSSEALRNLTDASPLASFEASIQLDLLDNEPRSSEVPETGSLSAPRAASPIEAQPLPQIALDDACRILGVRPGDPWETIELARRRAVQKSSPVSTVGVKKDQSERLLSEARLANDAAMVIAARRRGYK